MSIQINKPGSKSAVNVGLSITWSLWTGWEFLKIGITQVWNLFIYFGNQLNFFSIGNRLYLFSSGLQLSLSLLWCYWREPYIEAWISFAFDSNSNKWCLLIGHNWFLLDLNDIIIGVFLYAISKLIRGILILDTCSSICSSYSFIPLQIIDS